ncbi:hypothetical protein IC802_12880 [Geobacillus sp. 44C]|nr:hypothetical protein IC802_12880 [Geobacillus sp. 44C]
MDRANAETGKDIGGKRGMIASLASISLVMVLGNSFHLFGGWLRFFRLWALALA